MNGAPGKGCFVEGKEERKQGMLEVSMAEALLNGTSYTVSRRGLSTTIIQSPDVYDYE